MQSIDQLLAGVDHMMALVEAAGFSLWDRAQAERWKYTCMEFDQTNAALIAATGNLIDVTFRPAPRHASPACACCMLHADQHKLQLLQFLSTHNLPLA
jgi:hypothetical protein